MDASRRTGQELAELYHRHVDTVWRVCYSFMKNRADTEDMVQEAFLRAYDMDKPFGSEEHEKAWLIVTASNLCRDALKRAWRRDELWRTTWSWLRQGGMPRSWMRFWRCLRVIKRRSICTITRVTMPGRSPRSWAVPRPRSAPGSPEPGNS